MLSTRTTRSASKQKKQKSARQDAEEAGPDIDDERDNACLISEFGKAFDLDGIPPDVKRELVEAAPVLLGMTTAVYDEPFFANVMGMVDDGVLVDNVLAETPVTDSEISLKWKTGRQDHRWLVDGCSDPEEASRFVEQHVLVYGDQPDNDSFSMRYLRACYAHFVHNIPINWVAEGAKRARMRCKGGLENRHKLGPVGLRQQTQGLIKLVSKYAGATTATPTQSPTKSVLPIHEAQERVTRCAQEEWNAECDKVRISEEIQDAQDKVAAVKAEEEDYQREWERARAAAKELMEAGNVVEAVEKEKEARRILVKLTMVGAECQRWEDVAKDLECTASRAAEEAHEKTVTALAEAKAMLRKSRSANLVLKPSAVFTYPLGKSIPPLQTSTDGFCPCCPGRGFVARAFISGQCGCAFHPACIASLLQQNAYVCPLCCVQFSGAWVAQFQDCQSKEMKTDVLKMKQKLAAEPEILGARQGECLPIEVSKPGSSTAVGSEAEEDTWNAIVPFA